MSTVSECLWSMPPGPSEIERRKLFDAAKKQIESSRKKGLLRARDLCVKEELSGLERQINSAADGMLKELHMLYQSSDCTDKKMAEFAESNVRCLEGLSRRSLKDAIDFGSGRCLLESTAERVRSTISSSSIDFSAFIPTVSDVVHTGVTGATGYALASSGAGLEAERIYSSALEKLAKASSSHFYSGLEKSSLGIAQTQAEIGLEKATELATRRLGSRKGADRRIAKAIEPQQEALTKIFGENVDAYEKTRATRKNFEAAQGEVELKAARGGKHFRKIRGTKVAIALILLEKGLEYVAEKFSTPASPAE